MKLGDELENCKVIVQNKIYITQPHLPTLEEFIPYLKEMYVKGDEIGINKI